MKRYNSIQVILTVLATAVVLIAGCTRNDLTDTNRPQAPAGMAELSLGRLQLVGSDADNQLRATTTSLLPEGATLRLYAFEKGETDFTTKLATRTYTIDASGAALIDAGQDPLYLPIGEADIYLVGPVAYNSGTQAAPVMEEVATEFSVNPHIGVDLIAAYTSATIAIGNVNALPDMVLEHKMARAQVVVEAHVAGVYENLVVKEVKLYGQPTKGTFTLDQTGGVITPGQQVEDFVYPSVAKDPSADKYSATTVLIPQAERELKVETTFECNQQNVDVGDNHPTLKYRQSGLITAPLAAGTATRFSTAPITPVEIKWRTKVLPWNMVGNGTIIVPPAFKSLPPVSDALAICLDAYNAPTTIDGKNVWEDKGTAKNHAELMNDRVTWANNAYIFAEGGYMQLIKSLTETHVTVNNQSLLTIEMVFVPDNGPTSPNEGLLRIFNDSTAYAGDQMWKGNFASVSAYQAQSEYSHGSRYRVAASTAVAAAGVPHSFVWANRRESGKNVAFFDGVKYEGNGGSAAGYTWCVIGYGIMPDRGYKTFYSGKIKAVRIHTRLLTDAEILRNYEFDKIYYGL